MIDPRVLPGDVLRYVRGLSGTCSLAIYSPCMSYRYVLFRQWEADSELLAFVGLNPSTATEVENDNTVARCIGFAKAWGYGAMVMLNAFAFRSTDPSNLLRVDDPTGQNNDHYVSRWGASLASRLVCCWGVHGALNGRHSQLIKLLGGVKLFHLGLTKAGYPRHPLYLRSDVRPKLWEA